MRRLHAVVSVDNRKRCTLPGVHPGDMYRVDVQPNGVIILTPVEITDQDRGESD